LIFNQVGYNAGGTRLLKNANFGCLVLPADDLTSAERAPLQFSLFYVTTVCSPFSVQVLRNPHSFATLSSIGQMGFLVVLLIPTSMPTASGKGASQASKVVNINI